MIRLLTMSYVAATPMGAFLIAAFADPANNSSVGLAAAANGPLVGTTGKVGASAAGVMVDIEKEGIGRVTLGGPVAAGDWLTADANARAVKVSAAGQRTIGKAEFPGVAGDIINYHAAPGVVGGV